MRYEIDPAGVELIASFEGFVDGVYNDSRRFATCGYGHLLHQSPATVADHRTWDNRGRDFYLRLLHDDIDRVALEPMRRYLDVPLNQNQINAVASGCFNCGPGFVAGTVGRLINQRDWHGAAQAFYMWAHPPVLYPRRRTEANLFLAPVRTRRPAPMPWLTDIERRWCLEYDQLRKAGKNLQRRRQLRAAMLGQAAKIQAAARSHGRGGWDVANRRQRYHSLIVRGA
jgi:GH24 family phage-related lysozyme (muramidase)